MQVFLGFLLIAFSVLLFFIDVPLLGVLSLFIGVGVLRGYRRGKVFYLIGGRSDNDSCCS